METNVSVRPGLRIRPFYLAFIISSIQTGVGMLSAPRVLTAEAKHDAWVSVLISALAMHLVIYVMFRILHSYKSADLFGIQTDVFGKYIGMMLGCIYLVYLFFLLISIYVSYLEVVFAFIFDQISPWFISVLLSLLILYAVLGGLRTVVGVTFIFYFLALWLVFFLYKPITLMELGNFRPLFEQPPIQLFNGAYQATFSYLGLEVLFFIYPFVEQKEKAHLPAQIGIALTTFFLILIVFVSIGYFPQKALDTLIWPTLVLFKSIEFPFIERFDIIVVTEWLMVVLPNLLLTTWMLCFGSKRLFGTSQKKTLYFIVLLLVIAGGLLIEHKMIEKLTTYVSTYGFWIVFIYPFILLPLVLIKQHIRKKRGKAT